MCAVPCKRCNIALQQHGQGVRPQIVCQKVVYQKALACRLASLLMEGAQCSLTALQKAWGMGLSMGCGTRAVQGSGMSCSLSACALCLPTTACMDGLHGWADAPASTCASICKARVRLRHDWGEPLRVS